MTEVSMALCREELKQCLSEVVARRPARDPIAVVQVDNRNCAGSTKVRKIHQAQSILYLNIDYQALLVFGECTLANSLVWLIQRKRLEELLDGKEDNRIFDAGTLRLITGHSPDRRRVYVKPAFPFDGEGDHQHCICVLLADLH